jgi:signal transduction histidine kinase
VAEDVPFADMLQRSIDDFEDRSGLRVEFATPTGMPIALAPRVQVELLRIMSEALTNVHKHADATMVRISAEVDRGELLVTITDNGRGFVPDEAFDQGLGLRGMRERARLVNGTMLVMSELSGGTTVEVRVPVASKGIGSVSETSERTTMAPEADDDRVDTQLELPGAELERAPGTNLAPLRGGANPADVAPKGVQP